MYLVVILMFLALFTFLITSVPIAVAIGLSVVIALFVGDLNPSIFFAKMIGAINNFPIMAAPLFILAGEIMRKGNLARQLIDLARAIVGHMTGGMAQISIFTCLIYGALSGSSPATVAAVGGIMMPAMEKEGYDRPFATAVNTAAGCLGVMIPPSVPLILYGTTAGVSVGDLFIGTIIPGITIGISLMLLSYFMSLKRGYTGIGDQGSLEIILKALYNAKWALLVPVIVLGGIYGGIATPTEAGAVACIYAFFAEGIILKNLSWKKVYDILKNAAKVSAAVHFVVIMATAFGFIMTYYGVPDLMANAILAFSDSKYFFIPIMIIFLLVMGTFMDALANILIFTPILLPIGLQLGMDPIHFGVIMVISVSLGFLTPPVGVNLFIACGINDISIERLSKAVIPFIIVMLITLFIIAFVPILSLVLL